MNEQLQTAVTALIQKSITAFEAGAEFLGDQIPDVINQLLLWNLVISIIEMFLGLLILTGVYFHLKAQLKYWSEPIVTVFYDQTKTDYRINGDHGALSLLNIFLILPIAFAISKLNLIWLQIWIAPKLFLIEYAAKVIK